MKYAYLSALAFLLVSYPVYSFLNPSLETLIERQNVLIDRANNEKLESYRADLLDCIDSATGEVLQEFDDCTRTPKPTLQERVWTLNATGGIAPVPLWNAITVESKQKEKAEPVKSVTNNSWTTVWGKGYVSKHSLILTGSHDYRQYSARKGAGWKNNNPSGITWWVSNTLKWLWNDAGIGYQKGTLRPANEKWNYILFDSVEDGLRAKMISVRERWGKATVSHYLAWWGTDSISLSFDKEKRISELSDGEFMELFVQQLKKETPGYISQLVEDKILIIE